MTENIDFHPALLTRIPWLNLPHVKCPDPADSDRMVMVNISPTTLIRLYRGNLKTRLWQAWAHLAGLPPPIPNISIIRTQVMGVGVGRLEMATACFKGLKRPHNSEHDGESVHAFVVSTEQTIVTHSSMACMARITRCPPGTVLVVYVRFAEPLQSDSRGISGSVIQWEFVSSDEGEPTLPLGYRGRYARELWRR